MQEIWGQISNIAMNLFNRPDLRDALDIGIVAFLLYQLLKLTQQTRGSSVFKGLVIVLLVTWLSAALELRTLNWILKQLINTGAVLLVVLFQPELRRALEQIGRGKLIATNQKKHQEDDNDRIGVAISDALTQMARRRVGALIVIEGKTGLKDVIESGTIVDAEISSALLINIFEPNTPLHDGAVVIRGSRVHAAACILPLTEDTGISRELGTRHRAGLGVTETTDSLVLIASEETGVISMAKGGKLERHLDAESIKKTICEMYEVNETGLLSKGAGKVSDFMSDFMKRRSKHD